jgi:deazaflavin-dependent oxidoreductase (nitroreductase family)
LEVCGPKDRVRRGIRPRVNPSIGLPSDPPPRINVAEPRVLDLGMKKTISNDTDLEEIRIALSRGKVIDITTIGRQSGETRRIEIYFHNIEGKIYVSGMPRPAPRAWIRNLEANPRFTFHLKGETRADLAATARVISEESERRAVLPAIARAWKRDDLEEMVRYSPLIEVTLTDLAA